MYLGDMKDGEYGILKIKYWVLDEENPHIEQMQCGFKVIEHAKNKRSVKITGFSFGKWQYYPIDSECRLISPQQYENKIRNERMLC